MAFYIYNIIIYLTLLILIFKNDDLKLTDKHLKKLQKNLNDISYFIINKKSMIRYCMLILINI